MNLPWWLEFLSRAQHRSLIWSKQVCIFQQTLNNGGVCSWSALNCWEDLPLSLVVCQVGKLLYKQSSSTVKRLGLELGGNAAFLVFPTADLDLAVTIVHLKIIQDYMAHIWESLEGFKTFLRWLDVWPASSAMQDRLAYPPTGSQSPKSN